MKKKRIEIIFILCLLLAVNLRAQNRIAQTPPMGWNSFDCYGASVTEDDIKANADIMATHLKNSGWEYIVVDYCWFYPYSAAMGDPPQDEDFKPTLSMDNFGRLTPAVDKFPSSANGMGFKPLADYVHSKGLKFGIHVMRGIPRQAVALNTPVKNSDSHAKDIYNPASKCSWLNSMYGIDYTKKGAQDYYNSIIGLYADWGIDYIKVDDISMPYATFEIEAIRKAIDLSGRNIVLSLSPGATPIDKAEHVKLNANAWRISNDFWDDWDALKKQFDRCNLWSAYSGEGHWPDADMIPIGRLNRRGPHAGLERESNFTAVEQKTLMTLWCIFRSPLMIGGDLKLLTSDMRRLFSNKEVLEVNQKSLKNHQFSRDGQKIIWTADVPGTQDKYLAYFNLGDSDAEINVELKGLGIKIPCQVKDLWIGKNLGVFTSDFNQIIRAHGSGLYRLTGQSNSPSSKNLGKSISEYNVQRVHGHLTMDADWNKAQWKNIDPVIINNNMGETPKFSPKVQAKISYNTENIYVIFKVEDKYVRCVTKEINGPVWEDSCVEFFFSPDTTAPSNYFNLEINCGGTPVVRYNTIPRKQFKFLDVDDIKQIEIAHSMPEIVDPEISENVTWIIECMIPLSILNKYSRVTEPGPDVTWRANFYKIGDKTSNPHYQTWSVIKNNKPDFHLPEFFGILKFI